MAVKMHLREAEGGGQILTIVLTGQLGIGSYAEFSSFKNYLQDNRRIILDMSELEYLDSSALGMLLMLRERAGGAGAKIEIAYCSPAVHKILSTVKFDKIFDLPPPDTPSASFAGARK